ncbi:MAG: hypothetical protein H3C59_04710 [Burkholderiaceae bacterium]|nr:hypothetical protein [Burkholderiaceae bacterium]
MSFALRIESAPRALHGRLTAALAIFALAATLFALVFGEPAQRAAIALAALACLAIAVGRRRLQKSAAPADGSLSIDEAGRASWVDSRAGASSPRPVRIERWNVFGRYAWLRLRAQDERSAIDAMFVRGRSADDAGEAADAGNDWRRLRAWLLWYGRGTTPADAGAATGRARQ